MSAFEQALKVIRADLVRLGDDVRWAYADGFWPKAPNPDRPMTMALVVGVLSGTGSDPAVDRVPGARHDVGVGDFQSREAFERAVDAIRRAEISAVAAWLALGHSGRAGVFPTAQATPAAVLAALAHIGRIVDHVADEVPVSAPEVRRFVRRKVTGKNGGSVRGQLDQAVTPLAVALGRADQAGARLPAAVELCLNCEAEAAAPKCGGRCNTCAVYWHRNGVERPERLWTRDVTRAKAAIARAKARGDGWGMA